MRKICEEKGGEENDSHLSSFPRLRTQVPRARGNGNALGHEPSPIHEFHCF